MSFLLGTMLLAVVTALACALPGVFVVLRRNSMLVDACLLYTSDAADDSPPV